MKVRLRLIVWIAAGAGALLSQWLNLSPWIAVSYLAVLAILLWTTPANAIRLPTRLSAVLIVGGVLTLQIAAIERGQTTPLAAVIVLLTVSISMLLLHRRRFSIWWATLLLWGPWAIRSWWR